MGKEVFVDRILVNVGVLVATGLFILEAVAYGGETLLFSLGHYFILILICKLFEHKTNRDYFQILALSLLLMIVPAITCDKLWFATLLAVYLAIACYTVMVFTIKRGLDKAAQSMLTSEKATPSPGFVAWNTIHHWPGKGLWQWLVTIVLMITAGTVATFIAFPRTIAAPSIYHGSNSVSGFSDTVQLGEKKQIYLSKEVLMQVKFNYGGSLPLSAFYLRGRVFDEYRGNGWQHSPWVGAPKQPSRAATGRAYPGGHGVPRARLGDRLRELPCHQCNVPLGAGSKSDCISRRSSALKPLMKSCTIPPPPGSLRCRQGRSSISTKLGKTPPPEMPFPPHGQIGPATPSGEACNAICSRVRMNT